MIASIQNRYFHRLPHFLFRIKRRKEFQPVLNPFKRKITMERPICKPPGNHYRLLIIGRTLNDLKQSEKEIFSLSTSYRSFAIYFYIRLDLYELFFFLYFIVNQNVTSMKTTVFRAYCYSSLSCRCGFFLLCVPYAFVVNLFITVFSAQ